MPGDKASRPFRLEVGARGVERDVDAELAFHIDMRIRKLIASGLAPDAARAEAMRQFGDFFSVRAECLTIDHQRERAMTRASVFANLRQDAAYAVRSLCQHKGFASVLLLILALGIGANTALFSLVDALMLRSLPVPHPETLITIGDPSRTGSQSQGTPRADLVSFPLYRDLRAGSRTLRGLYASGRTGSLDVVVSGGGPGAPAGAGGAQHPRGRFVSGSYFAVLEVSASLGRTFGAEEDEAPGRNPVTVISHGWWERHLGGDPSAIGRTITINGAPLTIIGIMPPGFEGDIVGQPTDLWIPLMMQPVLMANSKWLENREISWLLLMGRLAPGASLAQAKGEISALLTRSLVENAPAPDAARIRQRLLETPVRVEPGGKGFSYYRRNYRAALLTLMAAVGLVLLIVCANVANLMLARAVARGRELSLRMALGAGRLRLMQQLLTESVLLAVAGGALGLLVALWGSSALLRLASGGPRPIPLTVQLDGRILAFAALLSLATAIVFGLVPSLRATRVDLATALRTQGRGAGGSSGRPGRLALSKLLVVGQVAVSLLLLVGTGMLVRSLQRLDDADIGLARDQLVIASVNAERYGYKGNRLVALLRDLTERVRRLPGVAAVSYSENGLFSGTESGTSLQVEGFTARQHADTVVAYDDVGPGYFHTIGAHLLMGRDFEPRDNEAGAKVAIVNQTMARFFFSGGRALGRHLATDSSSYEIVGVVADVEEQAVRNEPARRVYFPTVQLRELPTEFSLEVRATGDPAALVQPIRRALLAADPTLTGLEVDPLAALTRQSLGQDRMVAQVVSFFGVLALVLAALGLYAVMAHATLRRTTEFGLRMALGARPGDVTRMVLRESMLLVGGGVVLGVPAALASVRLIQGRLYGIGVFDPPSIAFAVLVLALSAAVAGYLPALRASRVTPLEAIRAD
jgi:predicted permease